VPDVVSTAIQEKMEKDAKESEKEKEKDKIPIDEKWKD